MNIESTTSWIISFLCLGYLLGQFIAFTVVVYRLKNGKTVGIFVRKRLFQGMLVVNLLGFAASMAWFMPVFVRLFELHKGEHEYLPAFLLLGTMATVFVAWSIALGFYAEEQ